MALAVYLVPKIGKTLDDVRSITLDIKVSLEKMYDHLNGAGTDGQQHQQQQQSQARANSGGYSGRTQFEGNHETYRNKFGDTENDITFFLYMFEVRKTRDIYGRIKAAHEILDQNR